MHAQKSAILGVSAAIAALVAAVPADAGTNATSPSATPTVGELSAAWWQWALSIPAGANPLGDGTGELCGVGQHGDVWFLAGTLDGSPANRSCRVPAGTKILFPAINAECSVVEDASLQSRAALRSCAKGFMDLVTEATASVASARLRSSAPGRHCSASRFRPAMCSASRTRPQIRAVRSPTASGCCSNLCGGASTRSRHVACWSSRMARRSSRN
jgi:hypothetical protein